MSKCSTCGVELKKNAKFCKACGSGLRDAKQQHQDKKSRVLAAEKKGSGKKYLVIGIIAVAVAAGVAFAAMQRGAFDGPSGARAAARTDFAVVKADAGTVSIPVSEIKGSDARFFVYTAGGKEVKFFVLRATDGTIRVALDACQACFRAKLGYHQKGDTMVCNNCGIAFRSTDIGVIRGGCNPIPLDHKDEGTLILVKAKDLEDGAQYF